VDIPGTKTWDGPGLNPALDDFGTNVHGIAGDPTTREQAVADALRRAGAGPADPVMLVGHSQGGLIAAQAAHDGGTGAFPFHVTHVLTAGAPIGRVDIPPGVQVLALENSHDIVPHLDARANADQPNVTTVTFDRQNGSISADHDLGEAYAPAAVALDQGDNASVRAYLDSAAAFLSPPDAGTTVQTNVYTYYRR
jgi:alpha-beta hydrolase superfamily lysophospholipase